MTVLVVGNATVDLAFEVDHLPRPGETLLARSRTLDTGGKGLNQAIAAKRTGADVVFVAPIGDDAHADMIRQRLREEEMELDSLQVRQGITDQSLIYIEPSGENMIVSTATLATSLEVEDISDLLDSLGPNDILLMQGNLSQMTTEKCLTRARRRGAQTFLNSAPIAFQYDKLWPLVDVAIANEVESCVLTGVQEPESGSARLHELGARVVIVTMGSRGAVLATTSTLRRIATPRVKVVDTAGAGDVFCGVLTGAISQNLSIEQAVQYAVAAASFSVTRRGTSTAIPSAIELSDIKKTTAVDIRANKNRK
jgi:ribokinase